MSTERHKFDVYRDLDRTFVTVEKLTKDLLDDDDQPRARYLHFLAERGRESVKRMHDLAGMSPADYAQRIAGALNEESVLRMGVQQLRDERDQIQMLLGQIK